MSKELKLRLKIFVCKKKIFITEGNFLFYQWEKKFNQGKIFDILRKKVFVMMKMSLKVKQNLILRYKSTISNDKAEWMLTRSNWCLSGAIICL